MLKIQVIIIKDDVEVDPGKRDRSKAGVDGGAIRWCWRGGT